jgi:hypothetical protein
MRDALTLTTRLAIANDFEMKSGCAFAHLISAVKLTGCTFRSKSGDFPATLTRTMP